MVDISDQHQVLSLPDFLLFCGGGNKNMRGIMLTTTNFICSMEKREGDENTTLHVPGTIIPHRRVA